MTISLFSGLRSYRFFKQFDSNESRTLRRFNNIHHLLMFFFLLGYVVVALAIVTQTQIIGELFVGVIFFFGAIFVLLGIRLQSAMNSMLCNRYEMASQVLRDLEREQGELLKTNKLLAKEIKERQQAETVAREREARIEQILSNLPIGTMIVDAEDLTIKEVNSMAKSMIGSTGDNIIGKPCQKFVCADNNNFCPMQISKVTSLQDEHFLTCADGREIPILKTVSQIELEGKPHFLEAFLDISDKKQLEEQLQRSQKMEVIGALAGGVAHDLNNILSGLISYPELLLMKVEQGNPLRKPLETIRHSGEKAAVIVQDLLTLARQNVTINETIDLGQIVQEFMKSPEYAQIRTRHPEVSFKLVEDNPPYTTDGSPVHMSKVVMNLLTNAAEAISGKGQVLLKLEKKNINKPLPGYDTVKEGDYIHLTIQDNGRGISPKDLDRIFEPFYTNKAMGHSGSGLGMAVVWNTVKDHRGYIHVESTPEKGTTFFLYFPATKRKSTPAPDRDKAVSPQGKGQSVLVVDDVEEQREIASSMLTYLGYNAQVAKSGETAIALLKEQKYDLVLLDMIMEPGIGGLETYKQLIEIVPEQKVILVSGYAEMDSVEEMKDLGLVRYIKKPYTLHNFADSIQSVFTDADGR